MKYPNVITFATGLLATFYGRHFTYTLLLTQLYNRSDGQQLVENVVSEIRRVAAAIKYAVMEGLPQLRQANDCARDVVSRLGELNEARAQALRRGDSQEADVLEREIAMLQAVVDGLDAGPW